MSRLNAELRAYQRSPLIKNILMDDLVNQRLITSSLRLSLEDSSPAFGMGATSYRRVRHRLAIRNFDEI